MTHDAGSGVLRLVACSLLLAATTPAAADKVGWTVGNSDKVYGSARSACEDFLKMTEAHGVKYVVDWMADTAAGDKLCYSKVSTDEGKAVNATAIFRVRRKEWSGVQLFRGTTEAGRAQATTAEHDLGPGVYYTFEVSAARIHAQARFLDQWAPLVTPQVGTPDAQALPDALVYEYDFEQPDKGVLDLSTGDERAAWEAHLAAALPAEELQEWMGGQVNPVRYYKQLVAYLAAAHKTKPADYAVIIALDWRIDAKLVRINAPSLVGKLDKSRMTYLETRFPSVDDILARLGGMGTPGTLANCLPTATAGTCEPWADRIGKMLFRRYGWRPVQYKAKMKKAKQQGDHTHLRIGDVLLDGTFMQFDADAVQERKTMEAAGELYVGELFVGPAAEMIARLGQITRPVYAGVSAAQLFAALWATTPRLYNSAVPQLEFTAGGAINWY